MKHLFLAGSLLLPCLAFAQASPPPAASAKRPLYCVLLVKRTLFGSPVLHLDYGQQQATPVLDPALDLAALTVARFTSVPVALTYLDGLGWECTQAASLPAGVLVRGQTSYLLRRRTP